MIWQAAFLGKNLKRAGYSEPVREMSQNEYISVASRAVDIFSQESKKYKKTSKLWKFFTDHFP